MEPTKDKRSRSENWNESEKNLLIELIKQSITIIECKDTTTNANQEKKESWKKIYTDFNRMNPKVRTLPQIISQWRKIKRAIKSRDYAYRKACSETFTGPPPASPPPEDAEIINLIPQKFIEDVTTYDSDDSDSSDYAVPPKKPKTAAAAAGCSIDIEIPAHTPEDYKVFMEHIDDSNHITGLTPNQSTVIGEQRQNKPSTSRKKVNINNSDYEKELFLLAKSARIAKMNQEQEEHKLRIEVLNLEKEYWKKKINKLD